MNKYITKEGTEVNLTSAPKYGSCGVKASYAAARDEAGNVWKSLGHYPKATLVVRASKLDFE